MVKGMNARLIVGIKEGGSKGGGRMVIDEEGEPSSRFKEKNVARCSITYH